MELMLGLPCASRSLPTMPHTAPFPGGWTKWSTSQGSVPLSSREDSIQEGGRRGRSGDGLVSLPGRSPQAGRGHPHAPTTIPPNSNSPAVPVLRLEACPLDMGWVRACCPEPPTPQQSLRHVDMGPMDTLMTCPL